MDTPFYVKQNFLAGLDLTSLAAVNAAARQWLDQVANVRVHGETHQVPQERFAEEQPHLRPLTVLPYDLAALQTVLASRRCRVTFETNRYSVPARFLGLNLTLKLDRLTGDADLVDGKTVVRCFEIAAKGGRQVNDRLTDRAELIGRWMTENLPPPTATAPPPVTIVPRVEVRHPTYYDGLLEVKEAG